MVGYDGITTPTLDNYKYKTPNVSGTSTGSFSYSDTWSSTVAGKTLYVRAYATNTSGTSYGSVKTCVVPTAPSDGGYSGFSNLGGITPYCYSANVTQYSIKQESYFATGGSTITTAGLLYTTSSSVANNTPTSSTISTSASDASTKWVKVTSSSPSTYTTTTITGLSSNTTYYIRSFASNAFGTTYSSGYKTVKTAVNCNSSNSTYNTLTDQSGYTYATTIIGNRCWMKTNLKAKKFDDKEVFGSDDATSITQKSTGNSDNMSTTIPYRYNPNGNSSNVGNYGYLYNGPAASGNGVTNYPSGSNMTTSQGKKQGVCPRGWHIPDSDEMSDINSKLNNSSNWQAFTSSSTNSYAFAGYVGATSGTAFEWNNRAEIWGIPTQYLYLMKETSGHGLATESAATGKSVRCVQDITY